MMDFREATACLDEYRISLANICGIIKPAVAKGELGEAIGKLNTSLIETLDAQTKEAIVLSIMIQEKLSAITEQMVDFPGEWADIFVALNQLKLVTDRGAEVRAEYFRKSAASTATPIRDAIREYWRTHDALGNLKSEESD